MYGFKKGSKPKQQLANGGRVRGPGTGTSDDIEAQVPAGSYIMPADSTEQIGEGALAGLGQGPVDVNLSNGEYGLPPEQVHAVGVQALDAMKNATHMPTGQPSLGFKPGGGQQQTGEPELFFADGGVVKDDLKKRLQQQTAALAANRQTQRATGFGPTAGVASPGYSANPATAAAQAAADSAAQRVATQTGNNPARAARMQAQMNQPVTRGGQPLPTQQNAAGFSAARFAPFPLAAPLAEGSDTRAVVSGTLEDVGNEFSQGNYGRGFGKAVRGALSVAPAVVADNARAAGSTVAPLAEAASGFGKAVLGVDEAPPATTAPRSPTTSRPSAAAASPAAASSAPEQDAARGWRKAGNGVAVRMGADGTPEFSNAPEALSGATDMPALGFPAASTRQASAPGAMQAPLGARTLATGSNTPDQEFARLGSISNMNNGTGTFSQLEPGTSALALERFERANQERARMIEESRRGQLGEGGGRLTIVRDSTRAPSRAELLNDRLARADAAQNLEEQRLGFQSQEARARLALDQQRLASEIEGRGFQTRAAQRQEALYQKYEAAKTPEERAAIAQQIRDLAGQEAVNRYTVVPGGQEIDPTSNQLVTRPARVLNNQTGQFVDQPQQARRAVTRAEVEQAAKEDGVAVDDYIRMLKDQGVSIS